MYLDFIRQKNDYILASVRSFHCGLVTATGGNLSVRLDDKQLMLVKPSGIRLDEVSEENLLITDLDGTPVEGSLKPTKETLLHGSLYKHYKDINAIVHLHPVACITVANLYDEMPPVTKQMKQITDQSIKVFKIKSNTIDETGLQMIIDYYAGADAPLCFLLEEHGIVTTGKTATEATYIAELAEENAKVYLGMKGMRM